MIKNGAPVGPPTVSVLGCGWMGLPLARSLVQRGHVVKGSTMNSEKTALLQEEGIKPFLIQCDPQAAGERLNEFLESDILFLNIPFRRDMPDPDFYRQQITSVARHVAGSSIRWIIFASSTSVYTPTGNEVTEDDTIVPRHPRQAVLRAIEEDLLSATDFATTVIRFAGLYGGMRELGRFIGQSGQVRRGGEQRVNLIHLDDCIAIVSQIIERQITDEILNAVSDGHPTRQELYSEKAKQLGLQSPVFQGAAEGPDKIVSNRKLKTLLPYQFIHPDPFK